MHDRARSLLSITGADAANFLQGLITQDVLTLQHGELRFAAMLSAQGKWQHDFFIAKFGDAFALDIAESQRASLQQKLMIYKLRAAVTITHDDTARCYYLPPKSSAGLADPRDTRLPRRLWQPAENPAPADALPRDAYDHTRAALCIPEGGIEVTANETAMDVSYDALHAISFTKGCYVGQEVTARMHYKNIARKGWVGVTFSHPAPITCPVAVMAHGVVIAELRSVYGVHGIAYGKFELIKPALDAGGTVTVAEHSGALIQPDWQVDKYAQFLTEKIS